jgi:hypothetical protein
MGAYDFVMFYGQFLGTLVWRCSPRLQGSLWFKGWCGTGVSQCYWCLIQIPHRKHWMSESQKKWVEPPHFNTVRFCFSASRLFIFSIFLPPCQLCLSPLACGKGVHGGYGGWSHACLLPWLPSSSSNASWARVSVDAILLPWILIGEKVLGKGEPWWWLSSEGVGLLGVGLRPMADVQGTLCPHWCCSTRLLCAYTNLISQYCFVMLEQMLNPITALLWWRMACWSAASSPLMVSHGGILMRR